MPIAVLNVRDLHPSVSNIVRIDNRNQKLAYHSLFETVLLYAPRDDQRHGYFGTADIVDVRVDLRTPRFLLLELRNIGFFAKPIVLADLEEPIEASAYDDNGTPVFQYFSPGIRALSPEDQLSANRLDKAGTPSGFQEPLQAPFLGLERSRAIKEFAVRDQKLRNATLLHYGARCAICRRDHSDLERGLHEVEICHLLAVALGGSDDVTNAMPMCRLHHWAYDHGLFTMSGAGIYEFSRSMSQNLKDEFWVIGAPIILGHNSGRRPRT